jgi:hypothetical protein
MGLQTIPDCSRLSLDLVKRLQHHFRRSFLAELCKNPDSHPVIPFVEMIHSRDCGVYFFDPNDASLVYGTVKSRTGVRHGDPLGPLWFSLAVSTPCGILGNGARILRRSKPSLAMESWKAIHQNVFCPDCDCGGYGGIGESLTNPIFVHGTPGYGPISS